MLERFPRAANRVVLLRQRRSCLQEHAALYSIKSMIRAAIRHTRAHNPQFTYTSHAAAEQDSLLAWDREEAKNGRRDLQGVAPGLRAFSSHLRASSRLARRLPRTRT